jgi:hypothetical protein
MDFDEESSPKELDETEKVGPATDDILDLERSTPACATTTRLMQIFHRLSMAFASWDLALVDKNGELMEYEAFWLDVEEAREVVHWGLKPGGDGVWQGVIILCAQGQEVVKLLLIDDTLIYGTAIGGIDDFDCYGAAVYFGIDGRLYYESTLFSCEEDEAGWRIVRVTGGYSPWDIAPDRVLDPHQY